jgi:large subunit ribosomal protein L10
VALSLNAKKEIVAELSTVVKTAVSALAADYRGLTVSEVTELRQKAREHNIYVRIVRNTLMRRVLEGTSYECLADALTGPIILMFTSDEPGTSARVVRDFMKEHENLKVRALAIQGQLLQASQLTQVANLPSKDEALAQLLSVMKAPITKMVRTMAEPYAQCVRVCAQISDQKQAA